MKSKLLLISLLVCACAAKAAAGLQQTVNDLLPQLAAAPAKDSPSAQTQLQQLVAQVSRPGAEAERAALAQILIDKAASAALPQASRVWALRQLELIGAAESVGGLTDLLNGDNAELRECARRALEKNPAPESLVSLRAALIKGGDRNWKMGLIQSLGERADAHSVQLMASNLDNPELAPATAGALGKIGTAAAQRKLWDAFNEGNTAAGDALLATAGRLAATYHADKAKKIYKKLYASDGELRVRLAALAGLAKTDPADTRLRIEPLLHAEDLTLRSAALSAALEVYGPEASRVLAKELPSLSEAGQVQVLSMLDASGEPQTLAVAASTNLTIRLAAVQALGRFGDSNCVPLLLAWAAEKASPMQKAAALALTRTSGAGVNETLAHEVVDGQTRMRCAAIKALAGRSDRAMATIWLNYASEPDPALSAAACEGLGLIGTENEFGSLLALALKGVAPANSAALQIAKRCTNKVEIINQVLESSRKADGVRLGSLFDMLSAVGGAEGLAAVAQCTTNANEQIRDAAVRALADWADFEATKPLLALAGDPQSKPAHSTLAIGAIVRLAKESEEPAAAARLEVVLSALKAVQRIEDKRQVISAIGAIPVAQGGETLKTYLADPDLKSEAGLAQAVLAESLPAKDKAAALAMARELKNANVSEELNRRAEALIAKLAPAAPQS